MKNGYELSRAWFDFAFEKKECKLQHTALYMWIVELNNRLGWKEEFGLPSLHTSESLGFGNRRTYLGILKDLHDWGFIEIIQEAINQHQACFIKICHGKKATAQVSALDTALKQHSQSTGTNTATIDKQLNTKTIKPLNVEEVIAFFTEKGYTESVAKKFFDYYEASGWVDSKGKPVLNWKQKAVKVWFKDEHKIPATVFDFGPLNQKIEDDEYVKSKLEALRREKYKNQDSPSA